MPGSAAHSKLTESALLLQTADTGDCAELIRDFCNYPDLYFSRTEELTPYNFFLDDIQFHYLPDTPWNELYRYWKKEGDTLRRCRPFVNENFRHAHAGFSFCITNFLREFRQGKPDEAKKYLGTLLHTLEDSTFGFHTMEGPGGTDGFVLDRLMDAPFAPAAELAKISIDKDFPLPEHLPRSLGNSAEEFLMRLYAEYFRSASEARKCSFSFLLNKLENRPEESRKAVLRQYHISVKLCADVISTMFRLARGENSTQPNPFRLEELEPFEFPFGGCGACCYRGFDRGFAAAPDGTHVPLELEGMRYDRGIAFGCHFEGALRYWIAPETFEEFQCEFGMHSAFPAAEVTVVVENNGMPLKTFILDGKNRTFPIRIKRPENVFGLSFKCKNPAGILMLGDPLFLRKQQAIR